jgi:hypothetical protein
MNIDVAERLIANLELKPIKHDQSVWLTNGSKVFVASKEKMWSCATAGCAAGFLFLSEAPEGSVFDTTVERVFPDSKTWDLSTKGVDYSVKALWNNSKGIVKWGAGTLGITYNEAYDLFYDTVSDAEGVIRRLKELIVEYSNEG